MEIWDAYKRDLTKAGFDLVRGETVPPGFFHLVGQVLLQHEDGDYLIMKRDYVKESNPGKWFASAAGSALKGETALENAKRELLEETGVKINKLEHLYTVVDEAVRRIYVGYYGMTAIDKDKITLQQDETIEYKWVSRDQLIELIETDQYHQHHRDLIRHYIR